MVRLLEGEGVQVRILTRHSTAKNHYFWSPQNGLLDRRALQGVEILIHLAGEPIFGIWTAQKKKAIYTSRVRSLHLLYLKLTEAPRVVVSMSAVGYYGYKGTGEVVESAPSGCGFLARVARSWERMAMMFRARGSRVVIFRCGVVLSGEGGLLPLYAQLAKCRLLPLRVVPEPVVPWVEVGDVARAFLAAVKNEQMSGVFNLVAGNCTHEELASAIYETLGTQPLIKKAPIWKAPLRLLVGELSDYMTAQICISNKKLLQTGFCFLYQDIKSAVAQCLRTGQ